MAYNKTSEERKWNYWKEQEEKKLRELGMEEEKIQKLRQMDREDFLEERRYREHLDETMQDMDSIKEKDSELFARDVKELLDALLEDCYELQERMMLKGCVYRNARPVKESIALNDIVLTRDGDPRVLKLKLYVDGQFLNEFSADGMIVATPTGSTAYNLSAGGPLVEPKAKLITLTPICPHSLNQRSIILSPEDEIVIEIPGGREGKSQTVEANYDGSHKVTMCTGDRIRIVQSEKITEFIQLNQVSFLDVLHRKMRDS